MADTTNNPGQASGGATPPAGTTFAPDSALTGEGAGFTAAASDAVGGASSTSGAPDADKWDSAKPGAAEQLKGGAQKLFDQAGGHARKLAEDGKGRAGDALDELSRMIHDAADQVDAKLGSQYGQYARRAADQVTRLADGIKSKQVDAFVEDARVLVGKSPAVAIGIAAALGFVLARVIKAGVEATPASQGATSAGQTGTTGPQI